MGALLLAAAGRLPWPTVAGTLAFWAAAWRTDVNHDNAKRELSGSIHPARRPWRTLIRVCDAPEEADYCHVVVPAWNVHRKIRLYFRDIPEEIVPCMTPGSRLHAKVNIGAHSSEDVYFDEWEPK